MPPMHMIGMVTMKLSAIDVTIWTCWTSLVPRVINVGTPNSPMSRAENRSTLRYTSRRMSRPMPIATRAAHQVAPTAAMT